MSAVSSRQEASAAHRDLMQRLGIERLDEDKATLAQEIHALRQEIAQLRADLTPVPSLILTGREVLDEFKRIYKG